MGELRLVLDLPEVAELMSRVDELQADVNALGEKIEAAKARISEDVQNLRTQLEQTQIDDAKLAELNSTVDSLQSTVDAIDPDPSNPAPESPPQ